MERTVFTGGAVFDASGTDPAPGEVVVDGDRIVEVRSGWREDHGTARVVNIAGRTIMPGLIESHAHLTFPSAVGHIDPSFNPPLDVSFFHHIEGIEAELARAERNAAILLDAGFTSAYSAGSLLPMPVEVILRDKIRAGAVRGPRLRAASAERDNHPLRPDGHFVADWQGPDACRQYVIENAAQGFDSVKFLLSNDDVFVEGGSQITQYCWEEAQAAGEQARESGVWLNCHAQSAESVKLAVRAGLPVHLPLHLRRRGGARPARVGQGRGLRLARPRHHLRQRARGRGVRHRPGGGGEDGLGRRARGDDRDLPRDPPPRHPRAARRRLRVPQQPDRPQRARPAALRRPARLQPGRGPHRRHPRSVAS